MPPSPDSPPLTAPNKPVSCPSSSRPLFPTIPRYGVLIEHPIQKKNVVDPVLKRFNCDDDSTFRTTPSILHTDNQPTTVTDRPKPLVATPDNISTTACPQAYCFVAGRSASNVPKVTNKVSRPPPVFVVCQSVGTSTLSRLSLQQRRKESGSCERCE